MIKVLNITTHEFGGAGRAASRLHRGLLDLGVESTFAAVEKVDGRSEVLELPHFETRSRLEIYFDYYYRRFISDPVQSGCASLGTYYSSPVTGYRPAHFESLPEVDCYNFHWMSWLLDWNTCLPWFVRKAPIVWTLHDANTIAGIWHYPPAPEEMTDELVVADERALALKRKVLNRLPKNRIHFVCPSSWLTAVAKASPLAQGFNVSTIPNGVDTDTFSPRSSSESRTALGLPQDVPLIGFIADSVNQRIKGARFLIEAINQLPEVHYAFVGACCEELAPEDRFHPLGRIESDDNLAKFYSAVDIVVLPSLHDNLPNVALESMACGTPLVAFEAGGIPDLVRPGKTGWLTPIGDSSALANAINVALSDSQELERMGRECRAVVLAEYTFAIQASRYRDLYQSLINQ